MLGLWRVAVTLVILPIAAATAAEPLDGAYAGQSSLLRGGPPTCPVPGKVSWTSLIPSFLRKKNRVKHRGDSE